MIYSTLDVLPILRILDLSPVGWVVYACMPLSLTVNFDFSVVASS